MKRIYKSNSAVINSLLAFIVYGAWAGFANREFGVHVLSVSAITQGTYAFLATYGVTRLASFLYVRLGSSKLAVFLSFMACFAFMFLTPVVIHMIVGTPNIITTILPGLIWGSLYILAYILLLHREIIK